MDAQLFCCCNLWLVWLAAAETPGISIGDIAKAIGEMWRGLSEQDKKPYQVSYFMQANA